MASYIEPIRFALIVFPFLALAISSVFFIYEYRKGDGCPNDRAKDGAAFICFMATFQRQHGIGLV